MISKAEKEEIEELSRFATAVLREYYDPIIGKEQNDYMLSKFQSNNAIRKQMEDGYRYYWIREGNKNVGFFAFYPIKDKMYLSKYYVQKESRGQGFGKQALEYIKEKAANEGKIAVYLNVNKDNLYSIKIYEAMGFSRVREEKNPIGNGFFMDDYVYEYQIET